MLNFNEFSKNKNKHFPTYILNSKSLKTHCFKTLTFLCGAFSRAKSVPLDPQLCCPFWACTSQGTPPISGCRTRAQETSRGLPEPPWPVHWASTQPPKATCLPQPNSSLCDPCPGNAVYNHWELVQVQTWLTAELQQAAAGLPLWPPQGSLWMCTWHCKALACACFSIYLECLLNFCSLGKT